MKWCGNNLSLHHHLSKCFLYFQSQTRCTIKLKCHFAMFVNVCEGLDAVSIYCFILYCWHHCKLQKCVLNPNLIDMTWHVEYDCYSSNMLHRNVWWCILVWFVLQSDSQCHYYFTDMWHNIKTAPQPCLLYLFYMLRHEIIFGVIYSMQPNAFRHVQMVRKIKFKLGSRMGRQ